ncbi:MAG TPA: CcmD family protein [Candidatus Solibacter sp.]|nr:CcmD family protein [Candidatus Solibacter sp.]
MNAVKFLFAAYIATWLIHGFYMGTLVSRFRRLRREIDELHKSAPTPHP